MKKIFIKAYTKVNLGDDLFIKVLCERYPKTQFYLECTAKEAIPYREIDNLNIIEINKIKRITRKLSTLISDDASTTKDYDAVVHIGGSVFIESKNWKSLSDNYRNLVQKSNSFFVLGSNFGPYTQQDYYETYKEIFKSIDDICFREDYSYNIFNDLNNVRKAPDVIFSLNYTKEVPVDPPVNKIKNKPYIVISVIDLTNRETLRKYENDYINTIKEVTKKLNEKGFEVVLMSFCEFEGDYRAIRKIISSLINEEVDTNKIHEYSYKGNMNQALDILQESNGVISTRFHSAVLSLIFNKPLYPIIYSDKITNVLNDINYKGNSSKISELTSISIESIVEQLEDNNTASISKQKKEAENHFLMLDKLIYDED